jgi:CRP/FNR family transcriptional regulator, cyclic AMP receptor protein
MGNDQQLFERFGKSYPKGQVLFNEGDVGEEMFVIQAGKIAIIKKVRDVVKTLAVLVPGDFFGEMAIVNSKPRTAGAVVEEEAKLLVLNRNTFEPMIRGNAEIAIRFIKKLTQRLQEADEQIENLLLKDYNSRVVHGLILQARHGTPEANGIRIDHTMKELANKIGLELEQVNEVLNKLIRAKLVRILESGILISDVDKLHEFLSFLEMKEKFGDL